MLSAVNQEVTPALNKCFQIPKGSHQVIFSQSHVLWLVLQPQVIHERSNRLMVIFLKPLDRYTPRPTM